MRPAARAAGRETGPGGRSSQLDSERQVVEATADGGHGLHRPDRIARSRNSVTASDSSSGSTGYRALLQSEAGLYCHEQVEIGTRRNQLGERRRTLEQLLEVVEQEQHPLLIDMLGESLAGADRLADRGREEIRIGHRCQRCPEDAVREISDNVCSNLPARVASCRFLPARSRSRRDARARGMTATSRTRPINGLPGSASSSRSTSAAVEGLAAELVQALGLRDVLEPVKAEVGNLDGRLEQPLRAVGATTWPPYATAQMRGPVDVEADVPSSVRLGRRCARPRAPVPARRRARVGRPPPPRPRPLHLRRRRRTRRPACRPRRRRGARTRHGAHDGARREPPRSRRRGRSRGVSSPRRR